MSTMVIPNEGKLRLLDMLNQGVGFSSALVRLIKTDFTVSAALVYADLAFADFSGYADATPAYGAATLVNAKGQIVDAVARVFTHNGGATANTIYGYALVDGNNGAATKLLKVQREATPTIMSTSGDTYSVTDKLTDITDPIPT